ncbi:family 10 glycosylhydrolase [Paenibacillus senegalensis]|uniref:family 10 glycosylhydrolase n=1 Tax=Paenibacillus senegalensis TaxID=1465766 RepID=UPI000289B2CB|nr:family 10 glycosylhydrolase [Paenibacillus senegalensis]
MTGISLKARAKLCGLITALFFLSTIISFYVSALPIANAETSQPVLFEDFEDLTGLGIHGVQVVPNSVKISTVSRPDPVVHGSSAVKLEYDFTGTTGTSAAYLRFLNAQGAAGRPIDGEPVRIGFWLHGDDSKRWVRAHILDSTNAQQVFDITPNGGLNWTGWKYVTFSIPSSTKFPIRLQQIYAAELNQANKNAGELIFDDLTVFYENTNVYEFKIAGLTPLQVGQTRQSEVYATYNGSTAPERVHQGVTFTSSDNQVASVDSNGLVTAINPGTATITASMNNAPTATYELTVSANEILPTELFLYGTSPLEEGTSERVQLFARYPGTTALLPIMSANYTSSNPEVAEVNEQGVVTAKSAGMTTITVSFEGLTESYSLEVIEPVPVVLSIELSGLSPMTVGQTRQAKVEAAYNLYPDPVDVTAQSVFTSSKPEVATVDSNGLVTAHGLGTTLIQAAFEGRTSSHLLVVTDAIFDAPKREMRAAWIATVDNIDWPARVANPDEVDLEELALQQKADFVQILDDLQALGMNAIIMQIKPTADSFYPSQYGPWSEWLTGIQGRDPGYDPLAFMIEEAHKRNLEFHAWFNPYRISIHDDIDRLVADHPLRNHEDWIIPYGGRLLIDPGIPDAQQFIIDGVMEVVSNYDIDAVHFDDYFYPSPIAGATFDDRHTYETYGQDRFSRIEDWRRDNVNTFISNLSAEIKNEKPYVKFGISPLGIWRNKASDPTGSDTNGLQNYDSLYADTRKWIEEGWIDYITPQNYWHFGNPPAAYEIVIDWWNREIKERAVNTHLYIGQAAYRVGVPTENPAWMNPDELPTQLNYNRNYDEVQGSMFYNTTSLRNNRLGFADRLRNEFYNTPALIPVMPWLPKMVHEPPVLTSIQKGEQGIELTWEDSQANDSAYYVIYRFAGSQTQSLEDPSTIAAIIRKPASGGQLTFTDTAVEEGTTYTYAVTSVDRLHNESAASNSETISHHTLQSIELSGLSALRVGESLPAQVIGTYSDGSVETISGNIEFTSSNPSVASVDENGMVTALSAGTSTISATYQSLTDSYTLVVTENEPALVPPQHLRAEEITPTAVQLAWDPVAPDDLQNIAYHVYLNGDKLTTVTDSVYRVEGLTPATVYSFYITAANDTSESGPSEILTITTLSAVIELSFLQQQVDRYIASGELRRPLSNQLSNRLETAERMFSRNQMKQAIHHLEKFVERLNHHSMSSHIDAAAKEDLNRLAEELLDSWNAG